MPTKTRAKSKGARKQSTLDGYSGKKARPAKRKRPAPERTKKGNQVTTKGWGKGGAITSTTTRYGTHTAVYQEYNRQA